MRLRELFCGCIIFLLTVGYSLRVAGQSRTPETKSDSPYDELTKVPEKYRTRQNPLQHDPEAAKAGEILFEEHCEECHGVGALGGKKAPSLRAPEVQLASDGTIFWILSNGIVRKRMPVWSKLPEPQRWQLVSYIKSLGAPGVATKTETHQH
jgi:mono/diheme cytochrome c family protein